MNDDFIDLSLYPPELNKGSFFGNNTVIVNRRIFGFAYLWLFRNTIVYQGNFKNLRSIDIEKYVLQSAFSLHLRYNYT